jgi:N-acetylglucosaminyldiphosphoundecaprenol N-acetyl-beta-D-mannosaminyltransferase
LPATTNMRRLNITGTNISATSYEEVVDVVGNWLSREVSAVEKTAKYICVTSVHGIVTARRDIELRTALNDADVATPDGMPVVWALRSFGARGQQRVYGPTLMLRLCEAAVRRRHRIFLYGGRPEVLTALSLKLKARYPELMIAGTYSPPFGPLTTAEDEHIKRTITDSKADLVFVGISTPKQEKWMAAHQRDFPGKVLIGVGAAFDFHAQRVRQAPGWMQESGLEWLFRLLIEPTRLWKRYLLVTPQFLPLWALQKMRLLWLENVNKAEFRNSPPNFPKLGGVAALNSNVAKPHHPGADVVPSEPLL